MKIIFEEKEDIGKLNREALTKDDTYIVGEGLASRMDIRGILYWAKELTEWSIHGPKNTVLTEKSFDYSKIKIKSAFEQDACNANIVHYEGLQIIFE